MSLRLHNRTFVSSSSSNPLFPLKPNRARFYSKRVVGLDHVLRIRGYPRKRCHVRVSVVDDNNLSLSRKLVEGKKKYIPFCHSTRMKRLLPFASADDGVSVNGSPQPSSSSDVEEMRVNFDQSLQSEDYNAGLVQTLHDAARLFELAIKEQIALSKTSWFSTAWLGVDRKFWIKSLSYQASVYSLLQAGCEISSRGDGRDRDINVFVQRSLLRQSVPLENEIREKLLAKQPEAYDWFWSEQVPAAVTSFVNYFEKDQRYTAATAVWNKGTSLDSGCASDKSLLMLGLSCIAAITKLGTTKVSCARFFAIIPDVTGRLMDMLVEFISIRQAYHSVKDIGLRREFLVHFGPRAAACRLKSDGKTEEVAFWVSLAQKQLQRAIDRERIWSRIATSESIEVLDRDLAIFGFFIALGRSTQSFLYASGFEVLDEPIEGFIRHLIGGSVLYYPQLSSISSYQLYVEVVCEELDWLPFYPGSTGTPKMSHGHRSKREDPPDVGAIPLVLDVCFHWIQSFIKYSTWLESPSNVKAAKFLSRGHEKLRGCMEELGIQNFYEEKTFPKFWKSWSLDIVLEIEFHKETNYRKYCRESTTRNGPGKDLDSFDKALESVEEAVIRLEKLLQEIHVSSSSSGNEHLKAACSDLERIRKLKKEAEFLEVSFRAKAASLLQVDEDNPSSPSFNKQLKYSRDNDNKSDNLNMDRRSRVVGNSGTLWNFLLLRPSRNSNPGPYITDEVELSELDTVNRSVADPNSNEIQRFELLRNELIELEKRVQKSSEQSEIEEEENKVTTVLVNYPKEAVGTGLVKAHKENIIEKSLDKLKETIMDVLQGTQLLAIDVGAASEMLRRGLIGDELTEKEKQAVKRTLTDLASVVPIGFLMLLPVTAMGHAAMLAAIQRYAPSLIPSTYGPDRLDLLRQLEKVKETETLEANPTEKSNE